MAFASTRSRVVASACLTRCSRRGTSFIQGTYVTHPWILISDDEAAICYGIFLPGTEDGSVVVP